MSDSIIQDEMVVTKPIRVSVPSVTVDNTPREVECKIGDSIVKFNVVPKLTFVQRSMLIEDIADYCFVGDEYVPYMDKFARGISILAHFTDLDIDALDTEQAFALCNDTNIVGVVHDAADDSFESIFADADELIEWRKQKLLKSTKAEELYDAATHLVNWIELSLDRVAASMGTDGGDIDSMVSAIQKFSKMDEKEIAHAVLDFQTAKNAQANKPTKKRTKKSASDVAVKE